MATGSPLNIRTNRISERGNCQEKRIDIADTSSNKRESERGSRVVLERLPRLVEKEAEVERRVFRDRQRIYRICMRTHLQSGENRLHASCAVTEIDCRRCASRTCVHIRRSGKRTHLANMGEDVLMQGDPFRSIGYSNQKTTLQSEHFDRRSLHEQRDGYG